MVDNHSKVQELVSTLIIYLRNRNEGRLADIIKESEYKLQIDRSTVYGDDCTIIFYLPISKYAVLTQEKDRIEEDLYKEISNLFKDDLVNICNVSIQAKTERYLDWDAVYPKETKESLLVLINEEMNTLIKAATAVISIRDSKENDSYRRNHEYIDDILKKLGLEPIHKYRDLWDWYNDYKNRELKTYESRRVFIRQLRKLQNSDITSKDESLCNAIDSALNILKEVDLVL